MTSLRTNPASLSARGLLRAIDLDNRFLQSEMATGRRVATSADNPSFWSVAVTMRSDNKALAAARDGMAVTLGILDTALATSDVVLGNLQGIQEDLLQAKNGMLGSTKLDNDILARSSAIASAITGANFNGVNLLYRKTTDAASRSFVTGVQRQNSASFSAITTTVTLSQTAMIDGTASQGLLSAIQIDPVIWGGNIRRLFANYGNSGNWILSLFHRTNVSTSLGAATAGEVGSMINYTEIWASRARDVYAQLGALRASVQSQYEIAGKLHDIAEQGIGRLVDADMGEVGTRVKASQVREQLGVQALHIANATPANILALFQSSAWTAGPTTGHSK